MVAPFIVNASHPLYSVSGVYNAIFVNGSQIGDVMFYGSGAGKLPTACAVVADIVDAAKHIDKHIFTFWSEEDLELTGIENATRSFFVRAKKQGEDIRKLVKEQFGDVYFVESEEDAEEIAFVTRPDAEKKFYDKLKNIPGVISSIRLEGRFEGMA